MQSTQAWETLNNPEQCGKLDTVEVYNLMLRAGYSEEDARSASKRRATERLDAGVVM